MKHIHLLNLSQERQSSGGRDIHVLCEAEANGTPPLKVVFASKEQSFFIRTIPTKSGALAW